MKNKEKSFENQNIYQLLEKEEEVSKKLLALIEDEKVEAILTKILDKWLNSTNSEESIILQAKSLKEFLSGISYSDRRTYEDKTGKKIIDITHDEAMKMFYNYRELVKKTQTPNQLFEDKLTERINKFADDYIKNKVLDDVRIVSLMEKIGDNLSDNMPNMVQKSMTDFFCNNWAMINPLMSNNQMINDRLRRITDISNQNFEQIRNDESMKHYDIQDLKNNLRFRDTSI